MALGKPPANKITINGHELRELIANECTRAEICRRLRCSLRPVKRKLKELGIRMRRSTYPDPGLRARVMDLVASGLHTAPPIARAMELSQPRVSRLIKELVGRGLLRATGRSRDFRVDLNVEWERIDHDGLVGRARGRGVRLRSAGQDAEQEGQAVRRPGQDEERRASHEQPAGPDGEG